MGPGCCVLPGSDEVLGQVDADWCSSDGHVSVAAAVQLAAYLDLRTRHLANLVDLGALAPDDGANQLMGLKREGAGHV